MAKQAILFFAAVTPVHNGSGEGVGLIDNPIMRERTTLFPIVQAPSIKGVLRDCFGPDESTLVQALFGPPATKGESHSGAVTFGDAQILAFPVRSLKGAFVWATSTLVLYRFWRIVALAGKGEDFPCLENLVGTLDSSFANAPFADSDPIIKVCPTGQTDLAIAGDPASKVLLEEFPMRPAPSSELQECANELAPFLYPSTSSPFLTNEFKRKLIILPENTFRYFVTNATEVTPNIRIDKNGTTADGSLRYTEYLPAETILYSLLSFDRAKTPASNPALLNEFRTLPVKGAPKDLTAPGGGDAAVKDAFFDQLSRHEVIQIGGDETLGKGIVKISYV